MRVIIDISVFQFYGYIRYIGKYFEKKLSICLKLIKIHKNIKNAL